MSESQEVAARERARVYLAVLATGVTKREAASRAGVRLDHLPYWRKRHEGFRRREQLVVEELQARQDSRMTIECPCGEILIGRKGQEFCSRSCAQKEVKSAYWGPHDSKVLEALGNPLSRRRLSAITGISAGKLRSILNRLRRRGLIEREGAPRGLYCEWKAA
jgi:transposase